MLFQWRGTSENGRCVVDKGGRLYGDQAVQRNCECQIMHEGCENNERDSYSNARETCQSPSTTADNKFDGEVQGGPGDYANVGMDARRLQRFRKQVRDEKIERKMILRLMHNNSI